MVAANHTKILVVGPGLKAPIFMDCLKFIVMRPKSMHIKHQFEIGGDLQVAVCRPLAYDLIASECYASIQVHFRQETASELVDN